MTIGIVDTTVLIHYFRNNPIAQSWVDTQPTQLSIVSITWLEVMQGAPNKSKQATYKSLLNRFSILYPSQADQQWAMEQLERFQFSHHLGMNDCLIASVAHRLQIPLYTHNLKDMIPMIGNLAVKPYP